MKKIALSCTVLLVSLMLTLSAWAAEAPHWSYSGEAGPEHWGALSSEYATCAQGHEQSPVNIPASAPVNAASIQFNYQPSALKISNNGHTIKVDYDAGSAIMVQGKEYKLLQFHFHAVSEHTLAGKHSPVEVHLVHQSADGQLAVVGVMLEEGAANAAYAPVFNHMPMHESEPEIVAGETVQAANFLPADRTYYNYAGSLTTPPCSEGVRWFVMHTPVTLSSAQIAAYDALYPDDYRPLQPLNSRIFQLLAAPAGGGAIPGMPISGGLDLAGALAALALLASACLGTGLALKRRRV
jgi:carbonic anhydrase